MVDNKTLPPTGTGTANIVVATDDVSGIDYQKIKLVDGTADSTTVVPATTPADAASLGTGLQVNAANLGYNGSTTDPLRSIAALDAAPNVDTGILAAGIGPGWDRKRNPANLGTAVNSESDLTIDGANIVGIRTAPVASGTYVIEATKDDSNWVIIPAYETHSSGSVTGRWVATDVTATSSKEYLVPVTGYRQLRLRTTATLGSTMAHKFTSSVGMRLVFASGDTAHDGVDSGDPVKIGGKAANTAPTAVSAADRVNAWFGLNGQQFVALAADDGTKLGTGNTQNDGEGTSSGGILITKAINYGLDGSGNMDRIRTEAGTTGYLGVGGSVAHDGVNAGHPVLEGAEAIAHGTNPTAVAAADRTKLYANRAGIPFVMGGHPNIVTIELDETGSATDVAMVTVASGLKIVVTQAQVIADNANTAFPQVRMGFGAANTPTTTGVILTHPGIPAGGGISRGDGSGILGVGADGEDLRVTNGAPTGGSIRYLVSYYTIES